LIAHVVLFEPRPDLTDAERRALLDALQRAAANIPGIRGFRVGRRITHGLPGYEQAMRDDYQFAVIIEFDRRDDLTAYLAHPHHAELGRHFVQSSRNALAYDYEIVDAARAADLDRN
jgi:stress responsive alpha/beta barrel protein